MAGKPKTRKDMVEYLKSHFRYHTMNSWNNSTSYARNIKIHGNQRGLPNEIVGRMFDCLEVEDAFYDFNIVIRDFDMRHKFKWQICSNGRSGGYLVLIAGDQEPSDFKAYCTNCGQRNYRTATAKDKTCGNCGKPRLINYATPPMRTITYPGRSTDMDETFDEWSTEDLKDRVDLVWDFDETCQSAVDTFIEFAKTHKIVDKTIKVAKKIRVAIPLEGT